MTNVTMLKERIDRSGLKICHIAECVGISRAALYKKINGNRQFTQIEIARLCKTLGIKSLQEKEAIFFADLVD